MPDEDSHGDEEQGVIDDNSHVDDTDAGDPVTGTGVKNEEIYEDYHVDTPDDTSSNSENTEITTSNVDQSVPPLRQIR